MNFFIETLNHWGGNFLGFAWPMFWQSSLLIVVLLTFDFLFRRKLRASLRYALWMVVLVKLCLPTTLALPTSPTWWLLRKTPPPGAVAKATHYTVTYDNTPLPEIPQTPLPAFVPPKPVTTLAAWLLVISVSMSGALLLWLLVRWWQITRQVRRAATSDRLANLADNAQKIVGMKFKVRVKLTANSMSPTVCGLFRPAILIPQSLADNFSDGQLRVVLLHELIHLRRRDVWLNFAQALLQVFYWWHPLLWLANTRIRRLREEAVDDAVMLALRDEAEAYAPTLLEVAKLALNRPLASLGLVGILESRHALRQRIERLVDFRPPRRAGLTLVSLLGILAFTAVAVPMGEGPAETSNPALPVVSDNLILTNSSTTTAADFSGNTNFAQSPITMTFKLDHPVRSDDLNKLLFDAGVTNPPTVFFDRDNGLLLVRGSREQLALVNRLVLKLNGHSTNEIEAADKQFIQRTNTAGFETQATTNLYSRTFKVDPNTFYRGLQSVTYFGLGNPPYLQGTNVAMMAGNYFSKLGVDLTAPGKAIFFGDRLGQLFVRGTEQDINTIERVVEMLNQVTPQVHIKARFVEVTKDKGGAPNYGGYLGQFKDGKMVLFTNPLDVFPGITTTSTRGSQNSDQTNATVTAVLTDTDSRVAFHYLTLRPGFEELAEPEVVTLSGRQTQLRATDTISVITNSISQESEKVEVGPVLDIVPYVLSDGYTINLSLIPSMTEFLGYDKSTNSTVALNTAHPTVPTILPKFQIRQIVTTLNVWDGQTVVLGNLSKKIVVGGKEVSDRPDAENKELLVFITVTIIDPAGNRVHADDELPFAQKGVPPQPAQPQPK